jgi:hypothetical protein
MKNDLKKGSKSNLFSVQARQYILRTMTVSCVITPIMNHQPYIQLHIAKIKIHNFPYNKTLVEETKTYGK